MRGNMNLYHGNARNGIVHRPDWMSILVIVYVITAAILAGN